MDQELAREFSSQMRTFDPLSRARAHRVAAKGAVDFKKGLDVADCKVTSSRFCAAKLASFILCAAR
jgi:hypothetical protein